MPIALTQPKLAITDTFPLPNSSVRIPQLGFGVYRSTGKACEEACLNAFRVGHRHVDTAQFYGNEADVGEAVRLSGIDRREIFVTTKVMSPGGSPEATYEKLRDSVEKIAGVDGYVDLFLIHSARAGASGRKEMWLALERLLEEGRTRSIGVSNFGIRHIEEMKAYAKVWPPHVNQIELHPWCQQLEIVEYCEDLDMVIEAYCPLVRNYKAHEPTLVRVAQKYNKTTAQVLVRFSLQKGWIPLPKSDNEVWIKDNANVYDFEISDQDMTTLNLLDQGSAGAIVEAVNND